jgi:hypothetical protein
MRTSFLPVFAAVAASATSAAAQAPFGSWVHDASTDQLTLYVSQNGSDTNSGFTPANAFATLDRAIAEADFLLILASNFPGTGVTINVEPHASPYVLTGPVSVPAFGVSIEPMYSTSGDSVVLQGGNFPLLSFDHTQGFLSGLVFQPEQLPPSVVRSIEFVVPPAGFGVYIDPTINGSDAYDGLVSVKIDRCKFRGQQPGEGVGVRVSKANTGKMIYANEIIDSDFTDLASGINLLYDGVGSELIRSNRISRCRYGMRIEGPGKYGDMRPRILSNAIFDNGTAAHPGWPSSFGITLRACSAQIVNNTIALNRHIGPFAAVAPPAGVIYFDAANATAQNLVIANNIFFHPNLGSPFVDSHEVYIAGGPFAGTIVAESNDFEQNGPLIAPAIPVSATNIPIGFPFFASTVPGSMDMHLTAASTAVVTLGNAAFSTPGASSSFTAGGVVFEAHSNLDFDLDPRTHQTNTSTADVLFRGADQFIEDGIRLTAPQTTTITPPPPAEHLADVHGNLRPEASGHVEVVLRVAGPVNAAFVTVVGTTLPMGPELQHAIVPVWGSIAIDPTPGNHVVGPAGFVGASGATDIPVAFGTIYPAALEAEFYVQALVIRPNGSASFTNRLMLDVARR